MPQRSRLHSSGVIRRAEWPLRFRGATPRMTSPASPHPCVARYTPPCPSSNVRSSSPALARAGRQQHRCRAHRKKIDGDKPQTSPIALAGGEPISTAAVHDDVLWCERLRNRYLADLCELRLGGSRTSSRHPHLFFFSTHRPRQRNNRTKIEKNRGLTCGVKGKFLFSHLS